METTLREPRPEKVAVVDEVQARLSSAAAAILTEYRGLPVKDIETLRRALRTAGGEYKIYKNTLVRRAVTAGGFDALEPLLVGPTGIAFVDGDVVAVAKVLRDFARTNPNLVVKGGLLGADFLDASRTAALAELPSREALLSQIAGLLAAPMQHFAGLLQALPLKFAYGLKALIESQGGVTVEATDSEPAAGPDPVAEESVGANEESPVSEVTEVSAVASDADTTDDVVETAPDVTAPDVTAVTDDGSAEPGTAEPEAPEPEAPEAEVSEAEAPESEITKVEPPVADATEVDSAQSQSSDGEATAEDA